MRFLEDLGRDIRYAARGLRQRRGFAAVAVLTLALGIGANTAVFSILHGVWLAPARYADPAHLVAFEMQQLTGHRFFRGTSLANLKDWAAQSQTVSEFAAHRYIARANVTGQEGAQEVTAHRISFRLPQVLGVAPLLGSTFDPASDQFTGPRQALLSASWWQSRFGGDPSIIGRRLEVNSSTYIITGVMPDGFQFPALTASNYRPAVWLSLNLQATDASARDADILYVVGRTRTGIGLVRAEMETITTRLARAHPRENKDMGVHVHPLNEGRALDHVRPALLLAMASAFLVLLIASANMASLLLARGAGRERELAVRRALGVSWNRLARQLLTESAVLSAGGCAAGVALAYLTLPAMKPLLPASMPRVEEIAVNGSVLAFAVLLSGLSGLLFSLFPLLRARGDLGARATAARADANRTMRALVVGELAVAVVLAAGAGLLLTSFYRATAVDPGFDRTNVLTMRLTLNHRRYPEAFRIRGFRDELLRRVRALPGVEYAGFVSSLPMGILAQGTEFSMEGRPGEAASAFYSNVTTDYLRAMGISLAAGRNFAETDGRGSAPVAIVSEGLAKRWWPQGTAAALGQRIRFDETWFTICGVARDVRQYAPDRNAEAQIYALHDQLPAASQENDMARFNVLVVRGADVPASAIQKAVGEIDPGQPVADVATMAQLVASQLAPRRLNGLLSGLIAGLALLLAAIGVFGVVSYAMERRTKEFGVRLAVGATPGALLRLIVRETMQWAMAGVLAGLGIFAAVAQLLKRFLFGVSPMEPLVLAAAGGLLLATGAASCLIPGRRALRIDPATALRAE